MWIRVKNNLVNMDGHMIIRREGATIRLETGDINFRIGHSTRIEDYPSFDRAKEVMDEFWNAIKAGERGYEFPEI